MPIKASWSGHGVRIETAPMAFNRTVQDGESRSAVNILIVWKAVMHGPGTQTYTAYGKDEATAAANAWNKYQEAKKP